MSLITRIAADAALFTADWSTLAISIGGAAAVDVDGIFDEAFASASPGGMGVETTGPAALVATADVTGIAHNDTVTVSSVTYYVIGIHPEGLGMTLLLLSREDNQP